MDYLPLTLYLIAVLQVTFSNVFMRVILKFNTPTHTYLYVYVCKYTMDTCTCINSYYTCIWNNATIER